MRLHIDTRQAKGCAHKGCYNAPPYYRHHLGNDGKLGGYSRWVSKNYYRYLSCAKICDECHMTVHFLYEQELPLSLWKDWTDRGIRRLREKYIRLGKRWLAGEIPSPVVTNYFRAKWRESKSIYEATLQASKRTPRKTPVQSKPLLNPKFDHE